MTLLYMDGFEAGDFALRYVGGLGGVAISPSATGTRFGVGRYLTSTANSVIKVLPSPVNRMIVGIAYYSISGADGSNAFTLLGDANAIAHVGVRIMSGGAIALYRGASPGTQVAITANGLFPFNAWNYIEFSATVSDTVGVAKVRLNGVEVLSFTGDTRNAGTLQSLDSVAFAQNTNSLRWDDLYICDDIGSAPGNDFLGDVRVHALVPTGPGANTNLTPSAAPNWGCVDELPYSAADFVTSATVGARDTYAMSDLPAGVTTVYGVQQNTIAKKSDAGTRSIKNVLRSGGTDYPDAAATALPASDGWTRTLRVTDPATSAAWSIAGVNGIEAGIEVA